MIQQFANEGQLASELQKARWRMLSIYMRIHRGMSSRRRARTRVC